MKSVAHPSLSDFHHGLLRISGPGVQRFNRRLYLGGHFVCIAQSQPRRRNDFPHPHLQRLALDVVGVHGQQVEGIDQRDGHDIGLRLQAAAQDPVAARLMGIPIRRMRTLAYCLSAALAGLAGFMVAPLFVVTTTMGFGLMLKGFAATIVGGWGSLKGAVLGGLAVGLIEAFGAAYLSSEYKDSIAFAMIVVVLLLRPSGLFPERIAEKF